MKVTETGTHKAVAFPAENLGGARLWNIIGVDLKDETLRARWNAV